MQLFINMCFFDVFLIVFFVVKVKTATYVGGRFAILNNYSVISCAPFSMLVA